MNTRLSNEGQQAFDIASVVLADTLKHIPLGSSNIKPVMHDKQTDKITFYPSLLFKSPHARSVDALTDQALSDIANNHVAQTRISTLAVRERIRNLPINEQRIMVRSYLAGQSKSRGAANCEGLSTLAFLDLIGRYNGKIEMMYFKNVDHIFVVLNRPENSNPELWQTWGENTIILDPWIKQVFTANEFSTVWKNNHWHVPPSNLTTGMQCNDAQFREVPRKKQLRA